MTTINTNVAALYAQLSIATNARNLQTVMEQLSTGRRINNSVDDVAGLAISTRLTAQIRANRRRQPAIYPEVRQTDQRSQHGHQGKSRR